MAARKSAAKKAPARVPAKKVSAKRPRRRDVTQTFGANTNTRKLLKKMGFTAD